MITLPGRKILLLCWRVRTPIPQQTESRIKPSLEKGLDDKVKSKQTDHLNKSDAAHECPRSVVIGELYNNQL